MSVEDSGLQEAITHIATVLRMDRGSPTRPAPSLTQIHAPISCRMHLMRTWRHKLQIIQIEELIEAF